MLETLAGKVPARNLLLASDYPFTERQSVELVRRARTITKRNQDAIL